MLARSNPSRTAFAGRNLACLGKTIPPVKGAVQSKYISLQARVDMIAISAFVCILCLQYFCGSCWNVVHVLLRKAFCSSMDGFHLSRNGSMMHCANNY